MTDRDFHDPLDINISRQVNHFLAKLGPESPYATPLQTSLCGPVESLLSTLSGILSEPSLTLDVEELFRPILFDLCARWLLAEPTIDQVVALGLLLEVHEELFP